jgi:uncharacterized protein YdhG (YjbR/CyaY superfamily)
MQSPAQIEVYLAALPADQQRALRDLRATLADLLPGHVEVISYAMPGFRQPGPKGRMVAGYAAFARQLGFYPHSGSVIAKIDCRPFRTSKSGVNFTPDRPLPRALVAAIVQARQAEIAASAGKAARGTAR